MVTKIMNKLKRLQRAKKRQLNTMQEFIELELMNEDIHSESGFDFSLTFYFVIRDANVKVEKINMELLALTDVNATQMPAQ